MAEQRPHSEPVYVVNAFQAAWNERDLDALLGLFDSDAVVVLSPALDPEAGEGRYEGIAAIAELVKRHLPGGSVAMSAIAVDGDTATWEFEHRSDRLRAFGLATVEGRARAALRGGRFWEVVLAFDPATIARFQAARARAPL